MTKRHEPLRHSSGERNLRKVFHHLQCLEEELAYLDLLLVEAADKLRYVRGRVLKIRNRMKSEQA
jgi:hypothetical protein